MIEVNNIRKSFGRKKVLDGVSFTANKGEITCLIGINGAGKTTILNAMMQLTPFKGEIRMDGERVRTEGYEKITFIPDAMIMMPQMKVKEAMAFMADFYDSWNEERAEKLLAFFRLQKEDKIGQLSKGNQAKVNLLLGLALDVEYVLMDEPFSGIDIFTREEIANVFTSHLIEDRGVIVTTHEINDIEHLIDKVVLLNHGKVAREFNAEEVRAEEGKSIVDVMREVYKA